VVVGFYSLAVDSVDPEAAPSRIMKGLAHHQCKGLSQALLKDALLRTAQAASTGASVIASHQFAKREASTPELAREAIGKH